jgi:large-conductance mechanosensitive channel
MSAWVSTLAHGRMLELAVALALGYALATLAGATSDVVLDIVGEVIGRYPFDGGEGAAILDGRYLLNAEIGSAVIVYGHVLSALLAVGLVAGLGFLVVRRRGHALGACPQCAALIPRASKHCAYCGSTVEPTAT